MHSRSTHSSKGVRQLNRWAHVQVLPRSDAGGGARGHEHRVAAGEAEAQRWHLDAARDSLDLCVDADPLPPARVAGRWGGHHAGATTAATARARTPCHRRNLIPSQTFGLGCARSQSSLEALVITPDLQLAKAVRRRATPELLQVREDGRGDVLDAMYASWPFFRVTMDMMAMVLAKGDEATLSMYEAKLVDAQLHPVGDELRGSFRRARQAVLTIVGEASVLGSGAPSVTAVSPICSRLRAQGPTACGSAHRVLEAAAAACWASWLRHAPGCHACPVRIVRFVPLAGHGGAVDRKPYGKPHSHTRPATRRASSAWEWQPGCLSNSPHLMQQRRGPAHHKHTQEHTHACLGFTRTSHPHRPVKHSTQCRLADS